MTLSVIPKDEATTSCSTPFIKIGDLTGCYHVVLTEVTWDEAQDACQALDPQAHLVSFETNKVDHGICERVCNVFLKQIFLSIENSLQVTNDKYTMEFLSV